MNFVKCLNMNLDSIPIFKKCIFSHKASDKIDIVTWIPFNLEVLRQYSKTF